ncbi:DUF2293 domain-containing protein [Aspergillus chevalieri]|uniref:DUF2293 domain-containing protein n=1 Tax=Aspergillus chevalieri TaxID=182096 RepID=A0A7R7ZM44_ASPCH|nr:uncharacterized protein ACHE_30093S [Aspergillus chevalieri]BCR86106.1 hypothetical protein ACHE_30093S [Aspergillus chevalieri]
MAPSRKKFSPRAPRKRINARKITKTPRFPTSILAQARKNNLIKALGIKPTNQRQAKKYSKYKRGILSASQELFEQNCFEREPLPSGYVFVPKGDVYVTRHCRSKTRESRRVVYVVYNNAAKRTLGLRVPADVYSSVLHSAAATASSRANAVNLRDAKDSSRSRELLRSQFPLMPAESLETILDHAFLKGSGRVGRTGMKSDERKADLAVEAHIRHMHTPYEELINAGIDRREAREAVWETVKAIKMAWEGGGREVTPLTLRGRSEADMDIDIIEVED